ncbi:MAG: helix-turn-helix domain-containing protein, partial [Thiomicrorhabdus sp.]|nr:helix-turn-helix domain-containing protein [Thiomicrorhabdus sp.]
MFNRIQSEGRKIPTLTEKALIALQTYSWPGNVRELGNLSERLSILFPGLTVDYDDLPIKYQVEIDESATLLTANKEIELAIQELSVETLDDSEVSNSLTETKEADSGAGMGNIGFGAPNLDEGLDLKSYLVEMEVQLIQKALSQTDGNVSQAAKLLQTNRTTLVEKIRKYDLS